MLRIPLVSWFAGCSTLIAACATGSEVPSGPSLGKGDAAEQDTVAPPEDASQEPEAATGKDAANEEAAAADTAPDVPNPCEGKTCDTPPGPLCKDADNLEVHDAKGTCGNGICQYASHLEACSFGCKIDKCEGDPCIGVTCNAPPANTCSDTSHLTVWDTPGSCSNGTCSYTSHEALCNFGCANNVCNGDPCVGQTCNAPPANYCSDTTHLQAYESPGTCANGACAYSKHEAFCAYGCVLGACQGDPCQGVNCTTPPANYCAGASTLRTFAASGTCSGGSCTYATTDQNCTFGCLNGVCKDCSVQTDCAAGKWCNAGTCTTCSADQHCGTTCTDCTALNPVQTCNGTACIQCTTNSQCGSGKWCNAGLCLSCNTDLHCGAACTNCTTLSPVQKCNASLTACIQCANDAECGTGKWCNNNLCATCNTNDHCGSSCTNCTTLTPVQSCNGAGTTCIQCSTNTDCGSGKWCNNAVCETCNTAQHCGATCTSCSGATPDCNGTACYCQSGSCGTPCPVALSIATWQSGADGWSWDSLWRRNSGGYMEAGSTATSFNKNYTQVLRYDTNVDLSNCSSATLTYIVQLRDDANYTFSNADKSERLHVSCSIDGGTSWTDLTPISWPPNQSACSTTYCSGYPTSRAFGWTGQTVNVIAPCLHNANVKFGFRATGASAWRLLDPGWLVDQVTVN
jgi:hypothetical protein